MDDEMDAAIGKMWTESALNVGSVWQPDLASLTSFVRSDTRAGTKRKHISSSPGDQGRKATRRPDIRCSTSAVKESGEEKDEIVSSQSELQSYGPECATLDEQGRHELLSKSAAVPEGPANEFPRGVKRQGCISGIVADASGTWDSDDEDDDGQLNEQGETEADEEKRKKRKKKNKGKKWAQRKEHMFQGKQVKPPPVICTFYRKGKCTKGTDCSFSHDVIPTTKQEPCRFFVLGCCLKGDKCMYSHKLENFPCKFFHTRGHCLDGDRCRFSHAALVPEQEALLQKRLEHAVRPRGQVAAPGSLASLDKPDALPSQEPGAMDWGIENREVSVRYSSLVPGYSQMNALPSNVTHRVREDVLPVPTAPCLREGASETLAGGSECREDEQGSEAEGFEGSLSSGDIETGEIVDEKLACSPDAGPGDDALEPDGTGVRGLEDMKQEAADEAGAAPGDSDGLSYLDLGGGSLFSRLPGESVTVPATHPLLMPRCAPLSMSFVGSTPGMAASSGDFPVSPASSVADLLQQALSR